MKIHLVDGTYELFRHHFGAPPRKAADGREVGATVGLLRSLYALVTTEGITHIGVAFDHVIESFRNDLYRGYKTSQGVDPNLLAQFPLAEAAAASLGMVVWPMSSSKPTTHWRQPHGASRSLLWSSRSSSARQTRIWPNWLQANI